jgi:hypothetical protein
MLVELIVDVEEVAVRLAGGSGGDVHLRRRHGAATLEG